MRLTEVERRIIRDGVKEIYGANAIVRLFGSRVHDHLRGGDIDLHIEADPLNSPAESPDRKGKLWLLLQEKLGEQRIDIIESLRGSAVQPIEAIAYRDGTAI